MPGLGRPQRPAQDQGGDESALLYELSARDGQTLVSLTARHDMTGIAVAKHLKILEDAGLIVSRRRGREKLHYLNPVPIRLVHDRWVSMYQPQP